MSQEEKKGKRILRKLLNSYLVMIIDEESFEEQRQIRVSRLKVIFLSLLFLGIFSAFIFSTIAYTPLKTFIPGYDSSELRKKAVQNLFLTDSLITLYNRNECDLFRQAVYRPYIIILIFLSTYIYITIYFFKI